MGLLISLDKGDYVILSTNEIGQKRRWAVDTLDQAGVIIDDLKLIGGNSIELFGPDGLRFWTYAG
jgi:hypothetical protein